MIFSQNIATPRFHSVWPWLILAFLFLGLAIAVSMFRVSRDTYRYLFVLDITQSMNVLDMQSASAAATRIEFTKVAVESAFRNLPCGSEAGLAIFTAVMACNLLGDSLRERLDPRLSSR